MANVCNEGASIVCPHAAPLVVIGKGNSSCTAGGLNVLTKNSIATASVYLCPFSTSSGPSPCTAVSSISGESTAVTVGGSGAILDSTTIKVANATLGPVSCTISNAGQTKLTG